MDETRPEETRMSGWRITPLPDARLTEAWPLVHLRHPTWTLDTWLGEARTLMAESGPAGLLAAETGAGYIFAVCGFIVDSAAGELVLPFVVGTRWRGSDDPLKRLTTAVEAIGREHGCHSVSLNAAAITAAADLVRWERFGYEWCDHTLRKNLSRSRAPAQHGDVRSNACP
jgi:hypothetical protein